MTTKPESILTIPAPAQSIHITPEMIAEAMAKQPPAPAKPTVVKPRSTTPQPPTKIQNTDGQGLVLGPTSLTVNKDDLYRYYFTIANGKVEVYYSGEFMCTLGLEETCGMLTGLVNLVLENLPCNFSSEGTNSCDVYSMRSFFDNITRGMCQVAEWCTDGTEAIAADENNLYAYDLSVKDINSLSPDWEPFSPTKISKQEPDTKTSPFPLTASKLAELQDQLVAKGPVQVYGANTQELLESYFGKEYIASLSATEYYELIDELYISGLADAVKEDTPDTAAQIEDRIVDAEYDDYNYGSEYSKAYPYTKNDYTFDDDDWSLGECIWYPGCDEDPDDETVIGIYDPNTERVSVCYSNLQGYPVNATPTNRVDAYPTAFMDITVDVTSFSRALVCELPRILNNIGLMNEIGPSVKSISAASIYALLATDPNINRYGSTAGPLKRIAFGTNTTYLAFRKLIGNLVAQLIGIHTVPKTMGMAYAELLDTMQAIYAGVDCALYAAYMDFRNKCLSKNVV